MNCRTFLTVLAAACFFAGAARAGEAPPTADVAAFLQAHCVRCHGPERQSGGLRVDDLAADVGADIDRWLSVREQVRAGTMPPAKQPRPDPAAARGVTEWIATAAAAAAPRLPNHGNRVPHELLFGKPAAAAAASPPRLWRLSPDGYMGFVREAARRSPAGIIQPFTVTPERGIKDFAGLYTVDEPSTEILLRNAEIMVESLTAHEIKDGKVRGRNDTVREFVALMDPDLHAGRKQLADAVQVMFRLALGRPADDDEVTRFLGLYEKCAELGDRPAAVKTMLQAVLLRSDAVFRSELGGGGEGGRRMLAPLELARAVSLALGDRREPGLTAAAGKGELKTREQVAAHVRRILADPKAETPRVLRFFQEYFEYGKAVDNFKDRPKDFMHEPRTLVADTDRLILWVLQRDRDVLRELLTTDMAFVNFSLTRAERNETPRQKPAIVAHPVNNRGQKAPEHVYGFEAWPEGQPVRLPAGRRLGILMQPSWLVAWATNFDNDPVRRGRWVRERLLGGLVPELPIGVAAQVPDEKHRTFRDRLTVTRAAECWKCHRLMDDLGLPFEQFDDYGRFRTVEMVLDPEATAKNVDKRGKPLGPVLRGAELDTTGKVDFTGDPQLDGDVRDPRELVRKLADSERVRQVFVRHAFRYFLGRNETLSDAKTLQDADRAYVESGGSFKELVVALLTSDAYLYRSAPALTSNTGADR